MLAQTYVENFTTSQSNEIRLSSLAGLYELGNEYETQADELFDGLSHDEQLALFGLATPANVGNELYAVISHVYQEQRNTDKRNELLQVMSTILEHTSVSGATSLTLEINAWLDGREQAGQNDYDSAITFYSNAWEKSQQREQGNPGILYDRALTYTVTEEYDLALTDFNEALGLAPKRISDIEGIILSNQGLVDQLRENTNSYPSLRAITTPNVIMMPIETGTPVLSIGSSFERPEDGMIMMYIPDGEFQMGSVNGDGSAHTTDDLDEHPKHPVFLNAYWMDKTEVTNGMYFKCVNNEACDEPSGRYFGDSAFDNYPVIYISWMDAKEYCAWSRARLPTEAEWEKAARGGLENKEFPWGNQSFSCKQGSSNGAQNHRCDGEMIQVGSFSPNGYGLYDTTGNVWEWVNDWYSEDYYSVSPEENPAGPATGEYRIFRGGSWLYDVPGANLLRVAYRNRHFPYTTNYGLGFRCARDAE